VIIAIDTVTLTRAQLVDIFAEGERRARTGDLLPPPAAEEGESTIALGLRLADYFTQLACEQAAIGWHDVAVIGEVRADGARRGVDNLAKVTA